ncbi:CynX/NimT family MFS transporter [Streptococcus saliviloxodontae]|uniref:CP family cyanate transporter-like MFS transporter n=1 Tax=Streptococcus saliviloxodontae TaxID=1349416 RepID=A0ABS2PLJ7_9STRE|nr:MFS transporter [Streptococcus saliviloxodontae]MBM7636323.1 CP family cyanate transporter-like MFS transporter [Streptococcus saliviloxodontae]
MTKKHSLFFVPGIVLVGTVLRIPFTTIPTVLTDVAEGLSVPVSSLGILTSIPLIMFATCSSLAPKLAEKFGLEKLFTMVLLTMVVGSAMRVLNLPLLYMGTMLLGAGIAMMNVLLPSIIQANQPDRVGPLTAIYTTSMGLASAIASSVAVPVVLATSWKGLILILSAIVFVAFIIWLPNTKYNHYPKVNQTASSQNLWKNKKALALLVFGGLQSLMFYTALTWLPTMATQSGLSAEAAGLLASIYSLISLPFSIVVPNLTEKWHGKKRQISLGVVSLCGVIGVSLLFFQNASFGYWLMVNLLIGVAVSALFPYLLVIYSLKTDTPAQTAQLSGMVQSGGYLLAAFGPALLGLSYDYFGSWHLAVFIWLVLAIVMIAALFYTERFDKISD